MPHPRQATTPDTIDSGYICGRCGGLIKTNSLPSTRTSIYNQENCTCIEPSTLDFGSGTHLFQGEQSWGPYGGTAAVIYPRRAESHVSSNGRGPEGPERDLPNVGGNGFLRVAPELTPGEERARRTSFRSEMSYPMLRYIMERQLEDAREREENHEQLQRRQQPTFYNTSHEQGQAQSRNTWLNQEVVLKPQSGRGSGKTKSWDSEQSGSSGEGVLEHWETIPVDPVRGIGAWAAGGGDHYGEEFVYGAIAASTCEYAYPMNMSGMTEALYEVERR